MPAVRVRLRAALALRDRLYAAPYTRGVRRATDCGLVIDLTASGALRRSALPGWTHEAADPGCGRAGVRVETLIFRTTARRGSSRASGYVEAAKGRLEDTAAGRRRRL